MYLKRNLREKKMKKTSKSIISYLNDFLDWLDIEKGLSSKTQENYARFLKKFFDWLEMNNLENLKPHQLTKDHIWKYKVYLSRLALSPQKKPLKKTTQNYYLIALRSLLTFFTDRDILSLPPEKVKLAKIGKERKVHFLRLEQVEKLLEAPNTKTIIGLRDRAILEILFSTGLRISELVALNRDQIKIPENAKDLEITVLGKGGHLRTVFISERALGWLKKYLETRKDKNKALFIHYRGPKISNLRLSPRAIEKMVKKYCLRVGVPIITTPHTLRHSFATDLLIQGVDLRLVQEFLGHKNIATTQVYTHVTRHHLKEIHRKYHGGRIKNKKVKKQF